MALSSNTPVESASSTQRTQAQDSIAKNQAKSHKVHSANSANTGGASQSSDIRGYSALRWKSERPEEEPWNEVTYNAKKEQGNG